MGAVSFDLLKDSIKFQKFGLHNEEEIYDFLNMLDYIHNEKIKGSETALAIHRDFVDLVNIIEDNRFIRTYHDVQIGSLPIKQHELSMNLIEVCASRLELTLSDYESGLNKNIADIAKNSLNIWKQYIEDYVNIHINRLVFPETKENWNEQNTLNNIWELEELDYLKKYVHPRHENKKENFEPVNMEALEEFKETVDKMRNDTKSELKSITKNTEEYTLTKKKLSKLHSMFIQVEQDISEIKKYNDEHFGTQNNGGRRGFQSYGAQDEVAVAQEEALENIVELQVNEIEIGYKVSEIKNIANRVLNPMQLITFKLYYENELNQRDIANLQGVSQVAVLKRLQTIKKKILAEI